MKKLRKIIFWCHLPVGVTAGVVILIMCVTGVLLSYEKQITSWANTRGYRAAPPTPETRHLPVETLITKAREARGATPAAVTMKSDPEAPAEIGFGREASLFVNPYTGAILGEGSQKTRNFFRVVTDWHRWLGAKGDDRNVARAITGACNLGFLFLVMSGFYLWWPRNWSRSAVRKVTWFRRGLYSKARDFQLAQCDRLLVCWTTLHRCLVSGRDLVPVGRQSRVSASSVKRRLLLARINQLRHRLQTNRTLNLATLTLDGPARSNKLATGRASRCNYQPLQRHP